MYHMTDEKLRELIHALKAHGLTGMEAIYSENSIGDEQHLKQLAREEGLLISGGSDFHGTNKPDIRLGIGKGHLHIPYSVLETLRQAHTCQ
jgi:hypothetical protein